jgi:hypothetical protein
MLFCEEKIMFKIFSFLVLSIYDVYRTVDWTYMCLTRRVRGSWPAKGSGRCVKKKENNVDVM